MTEASVQAAFTREALTVGDSALTTSGKEIRTDVGIGITVSIETDGNVVEVDRGIAAVVRKLNRCGFKTISSRSGLRGDHPDATCLDSTDLYICVEGNRPELIDVAEQSGWNWSFDGKSYSEDDVTPLDHVNFYSFGGRVYKSAHTARELRVHRFWHQKRAPSSKVEAIRCEMPIMSTTLALSTDLSTVLSAKELVVSDAPVPIFLSRVGMTI